jgi:hypothetical protein
MVVVPNDHSLRFAGGVAVRQALLLRATSKMRQVRRTNKSDLRPIAIVHLQKAMIA